MSDPHDAADTDVKAVEAYLAQLPPDQRAALEHLRTVIRAAAPAASEAISYRMPAFRLRGRRLVYYAAFRDHVSLFPASYAVMERLAADLRPYVSGKATLRFSLARPLPDALVARIVQMRVEEVLKRDA